MENIARKCDMETETDPDTPNASKTSSFSIQSVVGKGVFFAANVVATLAGAAAVVATLAGAAEVVTLSAVVIS